MAASVHVPRLRPDQDSPTEATRSAVSLAALEKSKISADASITQHSPSPGRQTLILHPSFITTDFDLLRFSAAAHHQLPSRSSTPTSTSASNSDSDSDSPSPAYSNLLISSPYNNPGHYLDLSALPTSSRLFALALTALQPTTPAYATEPYTTSLNFPHVLRVLRSLLQSEGTSWPATSFYVVVFRSQLKESADQDLLYSLDYESHREACESGGLLKYWFGRADLEGERRNLATCFWHSREDAALGGAGPWHAKARLAGRELYERIVFSTYRFTVEEGAVGYRIEEWEE